MPSPIAVVGAGPAGLTAALALRRLGLEITVFEQAEDFQRIGVGGSCYMTTASGCWRPWGCWRASGASCSPAG
jgi:2-polyprenyl-6-methoxyphenol hydroxylase-like FAD-dependent oxidoreductase